MNEIDDVPGRLKRSLPSVHLLRRAPVRSVAVVGCGYWGANHVRVLSQFEGLDVIPVDAQATAAHDMATRFRLPRWAERLGDVLDDCDAVVVATPPSSHLELGLEALTAGCHLFVEKPLAISAAESDQLIRAAVAADRTLAVGHTFLFSAGVERLAQTVAGAEFGAPLHVTSERLNLGLHRADVDVLWDLAPHDISILNFVLGAEPARVSCWAAGRRSRNNDVATLMLTYHEPDVTATVHLSWLHPTKVRRITIVGQHRMAELDESRDRPLHVHDVAIRVGAATQPFAYERGDITIPEVRGAEPLRRELADFLDCCETGAEPRSGGRSGRSVVEVIEAASLSAELGRPVDIASSNVRLLNVTRTSAASNGTGDLACPILVGDGFR